MPSDFHEPNAFSSSGQHAWPASRRRRRAASRCRDGSTRDRTPADPPTVSASMAGGRPFAERAVAMRRAEDDARERDLDQRAAGCRAPAAASSAAPCAADRAPSPGNVGRNDDVRHQRQRVAELRRPAPTAAPPNSRTSSSSTRLAPRNSIASASSSADRGRRLRRAWRRSGCRRRTCRSDRRRCPNARSG